jgi:hypothetical protein
VHSTQHLLFAALRKKPSNVPVFLIYAGVIHAIGLALLLPMLITLPGPGRETATKPAAIDVEIIPTSPLAGAIESKGEQTSALPANATGADAELSPSREAETTDPVDPEADPDKDENTSPQGEPEKADIAAPEEAKASAAKQAAKKAAAKRKSVRAVPRRPAKKDAKIAPFNGALSGLFSPGAPAKRR